MQVRVGEYHRKEKKIILRYVKVCCKLISVQRQGYDHYDLFVQPFLF